jgi:hypothetical protein
MVKSKNGKIITALLFISIVIWSLSSKMKRADERAVALFEAYPKMLSKDSVFGRITNIKFFDRNNRFNASFACFTMDDHSKYSVSVSREMTSEFALMDLLQPQMYLSKKPGNDTLELRLDSADQSPIYRFVLYR